MREEQVMQIQGLGPKLPLFCCRASHIRGPPHGVAEEKEKPTGWRRGGGGRRSGRVKGREEENKGKSDREAHNSQEERGRQL